jgi:hypothetical protein
MGEIMKQQSIGRLGRAAEVAGPVLWLVVWKSTKRREVEAADPRTLNRAERPNNLPTLLGSKCVQEGDPHRNSGVLVVHSPPEACGSASLPDVWK